MSIIEMLCPHCGHQLRIPAAYAGQKAGCIHCKGRFQVPDTPVAADPVPGDEFAPRSLADLESMDIDGGGDPASGGSVGGPVGGVSLSSLENMDIDVGDGVSPAFAGSARAQVGPSASAADPLGCLFWGLAFHMPPIALVWAFFLPKGHSQKAVGLGVSAGFLLLAIVLIAVFA